MRVLYDILESLALNKGRIRFPSDREAVEYCRDNGISVSNIELDKEGNSYIEDDGKRFRKEFDGKSGSFKSSSYKRRNHYPEYKGLEDLTDNQIEYLEMFNGIVRNKDGTFRADWSKIRK